jgi:thiol-disulfide isomerase/thioredoxin
MKTSICYLFLLVCMTLSNCTQSEKHDNSFTLRGKIIGQNTGNIVLKIRTDSILIYDTARITNGEFVFKGTIDEPVRALLDAGNDLNKAEMYIEPGIMNIFFTRDKFVEFKMTGSKTQEEEELLENMGEPTYKIRQSLQEQYSKNYGIIRNSPNEGKRRQLEKENEEIDARMEKAWEDEYKIWFRFIQSHPKSFLSPSYLLMLEEREYLSFDSLKLMFNRLDNKVKEGKEGQRLLKYISIEENIQIGAIAPDFKAIDLNNQPITLSQFRGKNIVLIEFWASWCKPCRMGFPYLKDLYAKYNHKGFEILAISNMDIDKVTWISAIKQDSIDNWHNLATIFQKDEPLNKDIVQNYPIGPVPLSLLIDKEGKVIGCWKGYSKENEEALEKKLEELLD